MESEKLTVFNEQHEKIGEATRREVHEKGYWHEAFHCWIIAFEKDVPYVYLQLRSAVKKDYPGLLDIAAAGHMLAGETVEEGVREVEEEIGLRVKLSDLKSIGVIPYAVKNGALIDRELAHTYVYISTTPIRAFVLQPEEVAGMVKIPFDAFAELWSGKRDQVLIEGFEIDEHGEQAELKKPAERENFVPHPAFYYDEVIKGLQKEIEVAKRAGIA
ncbi:NUDIX domain-containing protein [Jeotgalibacillus sp. R-1-5s-1]|uniref:NUDIX hydrolase n=1 Tax=Jeotgalibacillus sp. R-1-5s-1 TaxID=2555897 RepID=UPI00106BE01A|nr:NUDIX domain-containing protein [Jeotgalibacillus sp. R-1-5s-1]TFD94529.1 NUDIX domain-containing protein [Jeotgalibacillus sp. R-1-5s-1]